MEEEKKGSKIAWVIILAVLLTASLCLNGYLLIKCDTKEDIFTYCTRCGGGIYITYNEAEGNYRDVCDDCIRQSVYDRLSRESENSNASGNDSNVSEEDYAYVTRTGSKYHRLWCQYVSGKDDLSYYESSYEAESAGYDACSVCW